jgi:uncharacterized protein (DUF1499 family)
VSDCNVTMRPATNCPHFVPGLGIQDYGGGAKTLSLCPPTPNCVATSEEANAVDHYAPPLTYNPEDGRGQKKPASQAQAMQELVDVVGAMKSQSVACGTR